MLPKNSIINSIQVGRSLLKLGFFPFYFYSWSLTWPSRRGSKIHVFLVSTNFPATVSYEWIACARLSDSGDVLNEQSENKTRATWERGRWRLSPAPARFSHFFLLNDFSPLSRSLEQANEWMNEWHFFQSGAYMSVRLWSPLWPFETWIQQLLK